VVSTEFGIHNIKDQDKNTGTPQDEILSTDYKLEDGTMLSSVCKVYDWVTDDGRKNLGKWAEEAAEIRAKYANDDQSADPEFRALPLSICRFRGWIFPKAPWCSVDVEPSDEQWAPRMYRILHSPTKLWKAISDFRQGYDRATNTFVLLNDPHDGRLPAESLTGSFRVRIRERIDKSVSRLPSLHIEKIEHTPATPFQPAG